MRHDGGVYYDDTVQSRARGSRGVLLLADDGFVSLVGEVYVLE